MFHISPNKMDRVGYSTMFMFIRRPIDKYALETHNSLSHWHGKLLKFVFSKNLNKLHEDYGHE